MIVLDTHALIWWVNGESKLSQPAKKAISKELKNDGELLISSITTWEISMLVNKGRLSLSMDLADWVATTAAIEGVRYIPVDNDVAMHSVDMPGEFHPDPADRMITALARQFNVPLVTADQRIRQYKFVKTIW